MPNSAGASIVSSNGASDQQALDLATHQPQAARIPCSRTSGPLVTDAYQTAGVLGYISFLLKSRHAGAALDVMDDDEQPWRGSPVVRWYTVAVHVAS